MNARHLSLSHIMNTTAYYLAPSQGGKGQDGWPKLNYRSPVAPSDYMIPHIIPPYHINWAGPVYWLSSVYSMVIPQLKLVNKFGNLNSIVHIMNEPKKSRRPIKHDNK